MDANDYQKWDMHHHLVPEFYVRELENLGTKQVGGFSFPKWSPEASLKMMAKANITKAFLSLSGPGVYFRDDQFSRSFARRVNDYLGTITQAHPNQFGGFASVPLPDVQGALSELTYALDTLKLDGIVLMSNVDDQYLGNADYREFFAELNRRKTTVFVHPNLSTKRRDHGLLEPIYWWQNDTTRTLIDFIRSGFHREFPQIKFIRNYTAVAGET